MFYAVRKKRCWVDFRGHDSFDLTVHCLTTFKTKAERIASRLGAQVVVFELAEKATYTPEYENPLPQLDIIA